MGACCQSCALSMASLRGDPIAMHQTMGDILPVVVWPSDVEAKKREIDPAMRATDVSIQTCASSPVEERKAWRDFFAAWSAFRDEPVPLFGAANKYDEARRYAKSLGGWRDLLQGRCSIVGPPPPQDSETPETAISAIKWIAIAAVAAAVVYGVVQVAPALKLAAK